MKNYETLKQGYHTVSNKAMHIIIKNCQPRAFELYSVLLSHRNTISNECFPSQELLAEELGCKRRAITNMTNELKELGLIEVKKEKSVNCPYPINHYYFLMEKTGE